ncbi:MAG: helix-turn-helix domain-containing protein [Nitrospirota bacterium]|nr:helix-turn-helix domain-containing protein [Nitrospirota bacterium]
MFLDHYIRITTRRERERLARECNTTVAYLYQIAGGHRQPGAGLTLKIERATSGAICRCNLRPDLFPPEECHCKRICTCPAHALAPVTSPSDPAAPPSPPPVAPEKPRQAATHATWPRVRVRP